MIKKSETNSEISISDHGKNTDYLHSGISDIVLAMNAKMKEKDEKYGDSWKESSFMYLRIKLEDKVHKFFYAESPEEKQKFLVDIANIAGMLYDKYTDDRERD